ncbi:MAG: hypothetical protein RBS73_11015 [Prolixibacteraceae bacterium]|jgi:hypothetical protein|nr:hypothetical protein [Prolixibacteraceae bacterium]
MKKLLLFICFLPFISFAQNRIITTIGDTIYAQNVDLLMLSNKLIYTDIKINRDHFLNPNQISQIDGALPNYIKRGLLRRHSSIRINQDFILPALSNRYETTNSSAFTKQYRNKLGAGDYLVKAGTNYQASVALSILGSGCVIVGMNNDGNRELFLCAGVISYISGFICYIVGNSQIIKAGRQLNKKGMTLKPSEKGIGLALEF